jgi:hypothetical protein
VQGLAQTRNGEIDVEAHFQCQERLPDVNNMDRGRFGFKFLEDDGQLPLGDWLDDLI